MNKPLAAGILCLATLFSTTVAHACERRDPEANGDDRTRHVRLSAAMDDAQILRSLKLQKDRAETTQATASGSVSMKYVYFQRTVTIIRSAKGDVQVQLLEQGREPLVWKLGAC